MGYATYGVKDKAWHLKKHTADIANSAAAWTSRRSLPVLQHARAFKPIQLCSRAFTISTVWQQPLPLKNTSSFYSALFYSRYLQVYRFLWERTIDNFVHTFYFFIPLSVWRAYTLIKVSLEGSSPLSATSLCKYIYTHIHTIYISFFSRLEICEC